MKITTKFEIAQPVWFMHENRAVSLPIEAISVHVDPEPRVIYSFHLPARDATDPDDWVWHRLPEAKVFPSREALLESI